MVEERFEFTSKAKKNLIYVIIAGVVLSILGIIMMNSGGGHGEAAASDHAFDWTKRLKANFWINNVFFTGIALVGVLFFAIQYAAQAGWSAGIKRIPLAFGSWIPIGFVLMFGGYWLVGHDIFHWTHHTLYDTASPDFDRIINGKKGYFFWPLSDHPSIPVFFLGRMIVFFAIWYWLFTKLRKMALAEDLEGGTDYWYKMRSVSAIFIVFYAVSSSVAAWDWVMSIDTHWFSTMFGWYSFASWWVAALALITLMVVLLKEMGLLSVVNSNHIHDLGKFVFAFSIFWTYIWFSQFLLIYYANIPEETIYFVERWLNGTYAPTFYMVLILNFFLPFLLLMPRDSKRHTVYLKVVTPIVIFGHWLDFYMMITPGTLKENGGFGLLELGMLSVYTGVFLFIVLRSLASAPLFAKNHPMLEESLHHHI